MATENELELLDKYLANKLSGQEKSVFEKTLASDPSLKKEMEFQQQLVEGIKRERVMELKNLLSRIPVPAASTGSSLALKASLFVAASVAVVLTLYFSLQKTEKIEKVTTPAVQKATEQQPKEQPVIVQPLADSPTVTNEEATKKDSKKEIPATVKNNKKGNQTVTTQPEFNVFDPTKELEADQPVETPEMATEEVSSETLSASKIVVEVDNTNKKLNFHYQFKDGKLLLYGSFQKDLYEILEFFSNNKHTSFLFYNSNYYLLNEKQTKPAQLKPISDPALLKKLTEYRDN